jgi:hypothetical protein
MKNFYITFGQKYGREPHPSGLNIHPDGYVRIEADSESEARDIAFDTLGEYWAFCYHEKSFLSDISYYPIGELYCIKKVTNDEGTITSITDSNS